MARQQDIVNSTKGRWKQRSPRRPPPARQGPLEAHPRSPRSFPSLVQLLRCCPYCPRPRELRLLASGCGPTPTRAAAACGRISGTPVHFMVHHCRIGGVTLKQFLGSGPSIRCPPRTLTPNKYDTDNTQYTILTPQRYTHIARKSNTKRKDVPGTYFQEGTPFEDRAPS